MRPANEEQAIRLMIYLVKRKITGNRSTKVKEHLARSRLIAKIIYKRFQVGPYQYQLKHLQWYLIVHTKDLSPQTRYRYWLTIRYIIQALNKESTWNSLLLKP